MCRITPVAEVLPPMRRAVPGEETRVSELLQACGRDLAERLGLMNWSKPYPLEFIREEVGRGEVWVLEEQGQFIGTLTLDSSLPDEYQAEWFSEPDAESSYLHRLGIDPNIQGRGLGAHCLREAERITREKGLPWLRFDAYSRNPGIQAFYQKQGYTPLRQFQMTLPSIGTDTFTLYEKRLASVG